MTHDDYKPREYFHALLWAYLIYVRNDLEGDNLPLSADVAYALHNVPSMLLSKEWTPEISNAAWKEVWGAAGFRNCREWFVQTDQDLRNATAQGYPLLSEHSFDLSEDLQ